MPFLDALFVASSAISTTGLSVVDIGTAYTTFGQVVIFLLFQIGGLGYMTFFALFVIIL
jgi:trk system potassium uptake protein TrkH